MVDGALMCRYYSVLFICTDVGQNVIKQQQTEISKCAWL